MWGTGRASREYLYVDDAAAGILLAAEHTEGTEPVNLGTDHEITILETAERIAALTGFDGDLVWDPTQPDGQPRRRVDPSRAEHLFGWRARCLSRTACAARSTGTSPTAKKPNARLTDRRVASRACSPRLDGLAALVGAHRGASSAGGPRAPGLSRRPALGSGTVPMAVEVGGASAAAS